VRGILKVMAARWLLTAAACAAVAFAQSPTDTGGISGTILDQQKGQPLKGTDVCLSGPENSCAFTEADGRFDFRVAAGRYTLTARRAGYISGVYGARPGGQGTVLAVVPGMLIGDLKFRLQRFSIVSGRVTNEDEEPIDGAEIVVWILPDQNSSRPLMRAASGVTNDLGEYRVAGLRPGNYYVSAAPRLPEMPCLGANADVKEAKPGFPKRIYGMTFYPEAPDTDEAVPLQVDPALDLKDVNFTLPPVRAQVLRGRVELNLTGVSSPTISLARPDLASPPRVAQVEPPDGSFAFCGVLPGRYLLEGSWQVGGRVLHAREEVAVGDAPVNEVLVRPSIAAQVTGHVKVDGTGSPDLGHLDIRLFGVERSQFTTLKPDRSFTFQNVWPGEYRLQFPSTPSCCYLKAVKLRGQDVLRDGFQVEAGESLNGLELVLGTDAANVAGVVLDSGGKPVPGVLVSIVPDRSAAQPGIWGTSANTDQAGGFVLLGVPPGEYRIYAWEDPGNIEWYRPEALSKFRDSSTPISVPEGAGQPATVHLIPN
jgi:hypothetical protein